MKIVRSLLLLIFLVGGCTQAPQEQKETLLIFGTLLDIQVLSPDTSGFQHVMTELNGMFERMHRDWHAWKGDGELMRLNRAISQGEAFELSPELAGLLREGQRYSVESEGIFNPAIGNLIALWGFHQDEPPSGPPPAESEIQALVASAPAMTDLQFDGLRVSARNPAVQLDLGAYAKGAALHQALDKLRAAGFIQAIVNAGGDLCVSGQHGDRPWRIGVRHPQNGGVIAMVEAADGECVMTSGNYERYRENAGKRYAHIIDPRTGYPVEHVASATVIASNGALADAAATALSVAGPQEWQRIARQLGVDQVMLVDEQGRIYLTRRMRARITIENEAEQHIEVVD